jgi:hypothetical protein
MFEATILLALLGLMLWFIMARGQTRPVRRAFFINLSAELKPPAKKPGKGRLL